MDITKLQYIFFFLWVFSLGHADEKISNYRLLIPDYEYRWAYQENIDNDTVTIIDKDGEITICQVMENGVIVCL